MFSKSILKRHIMLLLLILAVGFLRLLLENVLHWPYGCAIALFYVSFYFYWMRTCRQRFSQKQVRQFITAFGFFVILFALLRLVKQEFCVQEGTFSRYIWYLYYVPITLLPTLNFHAILYAIRPNSAPPSKQWYWLYVPVGLMIAGVLTNDLHQFAFIFPADMVSWEQRYTHGPLFQIVTAWVVLMILGLFLVLIKSCINRRLYRNLWLPVLVAAVGLTYRLNYVFYDVGGKILLQKMYELPELFGLVWIAVWESAVASRLLPSNRGYSEYLQASSLHAGIADAGFQICQSYGDTVHPDASQLRAAADGAVALQGGDTVLRARKVRGGWFYWTEDMRELNSLNEALEDTSDYLIEENAMLQQSAEIEEERRRTAHQTKLYDDISLRIRSRIDLLSDLLQDPPEEEEAFCLMLKKCALLFSFLKRFSNLLLLTDAQGGASSDDLKLCLRESVRALQGLGIRCTLNVPEGLDLPGETAADMYEMFELVIEEAYPALQEVRVSLCESAFTVEYSVLSSASDAAEWQTITVNAAEVSGLLPGLRKAALQAAASNGKEGQA